MTILVVSPGAAYSTADVDAGLRYGLEQQGIQVVRYRLTERIARSRRWLYEAWRSARRRNPTITKPTTADVFYQAGEGALAMALRHNVDIVLVVSAMFLHPDIIILMRRAGLCVVALLTEAPYDLAQETKIAALVNACWTTERTAVPAFRQVNRHVRYLRHGWHPAIHQPQASGPPGHDVVFVGSGFKERIDWLSAVDWSGIDLGLYGHWTLPAHHPLRPFVKGGLTSPDQTTDLYRRARLGLNLYRASSSAESLNPRAYELAACGVCHVSTPRREVEETFGALVPTAAQPADAARIIRRLLADDDRRRSIAHTLPTTVADASWTDRAAEVVGALTALTAAAA